MLTLVFLQGGSVEHSRTLPTPKPHFSVAMTGCSDMDPVAQITPNARNAFHCSMYIPGTSKNLTFTSLIMDFLLDICAHKK